MVILLNIKKIHLSPPPRMKASFSVSSAFLSICFVFSSLALATRESIAPWIALMAWSNRITQLHVSFHVLFPLCHLCRRHILGIPTRAGHFGLCLVDLLAHSLFMILEQANLSIVPNILRIAHHVRPCVGSDRVLKHHLPPC